jgi:thioredoxin 1
VGKAKFVKVNVDENPAVSQAFNIRGVPSFFIMKGKKIKEAVVGADLRKLEASLQKILSKEQTQTTPIN